MAEKKSKRGGVRPNAGRKPSGRNIQLLVRIDKEAHEKISKVANKSEWINNVIKKYLK